MRLFDLSALGLQAKDSELKRLTDELQMMTHLKVSLCTLPLTGWLSGWLSVWLSGWFIPQHGAAAVALRQQQPLHNQRCLAVLSGIAATHAILLSFTCVIQVELTNSDRAMQSRMAEVPCTELPAQTVYKVRLVRWT